MASPLQAAASVVAYDPIWGDVNMISQGSPPVPGRISASRLGSSEGFALVPSRKLFAFFRPKACHALACCGRRLMPGEPDRPFAQAPNATLESTPLMSRSLSMLIDAAPSISLIISSISCKFMCRFLRHGRLLLTPCWGTPINLSTSPKAGNRSFGSSTHPASLTWHPFCSVIR